MSRSAHTYALDGIEVVLTVPEGVRVPRVLVLRETAGGHVLEFEHVGVKAVRATAKRKPQQARPLTKMPEDWLPPEHEVAQANIKAPSVNVEFETAQFVDWAISKGEKRADWLAAWRTWIRRTHQRNLEAGWKPKSAPAAEDARAKWCRLHGVTVEEYEAKKGDAEWLERIKRRGVVA
ncbi:MAG: hypothetical protein BGN97_03585 [Microbacterium sp. 69-10]|nr:MAG: hypothetical protein BGN97_03585 [Microbacterium sp. 69-10]